MHKPSFSVRAGRTVESLEHDPIDENFDGLDVNIIPGVGKGPSIQEYVIEDGISYDDELWHAEKNEEPCMSHKEMDEQMYDDFDKEPPPAGIMLHQGAVGNLRTRPRLIFNGRPCMKTIPNFDPSIDPTGAPSWSDLVSFALNPHCLEEEADQPPSESGSAKPLSINPYDAGHGHETRQEDAEPTPFLESPSGSMPSGSDSLNANADRNISEKSFSINVQQGSIEKLQKKHVQALPVTISERRLKQVQENSRTKENKAEKSTRIVTASRGGNEPAANSSRPPAQVHRQLSSRARPTFLARHR